MNKTYEQDQDKTNTQTHVMSLIKLYHTHMITCTTCQHKPNAHVVHNYHVT